MLTIKFRAFKMKVFVINQHGEILMLKNKVKRGNSSPQLKTKGFSCHHFYKYMQQWIQAGREETEVISLFDSRL